MVTATSPCPPVLTTCCAAAGPAIASPAISRPHVLDPQVLDPQAIATSPPVSLSSAHLLPERLDHAVVRGHPHPPHPARPTPFPFRWFGVDREWNQDFELGVEGPRIGQRHLPVLIFALWPATGDDAIILHRRAEPEFIVDAFALRLVADPRLADEQSPARDRLEHRSRAGGQGQPEAVRLAILHAQHHRQRLHAPGHPVIEDGGIELLDRDLILYQQSATPPFAPPAPRGGGWGGGALPPPSFPLARGRPSFRPPPPRGGRGEKGAPAADQG